MNARTLLAFAALSAAPLAHGQLPQPPDPANSVALTIYSTARPGAIPADIYRPVPQSMQAQRGYNPYQHMPLPGFALVKHERRADLRQGLSVHRVEDVAALLDPTTVTFESLTDPKGTRVMEQSYQFDLVNSQRMLERFVGKEVSIDGSTVALLSASAAGGLLVREPDGKVLWKQGFGSLRFPEMGSGMILKPTLIWNLATGREGPHDIRYSYQTDGIVWWADYNLIWHEAEGGREGSEDTGRLDVSAWVSILNQSGASYENAGLKLIAGDVHRVLPPGQAYPAANALDFAAARSEMSRPGFAEKSFFEYHLYTLGRRTSIPDNSTKQIELFDPVAGVAAEKVLVYYGLPQEYRGFFPQPMTDREFGTVTNKKVDVYLRFKNSKENGMGMPLPTGRIRVNKMDDADKSLEFIGEDVVDHTPKDEEVLVRMGEAFDVVGERFQTDYQINVGEHWLTETIEIQVRNHKATPANVIVKENLYRWANWKIENASQPYDKPDSRIIHFKLRVEPDKEGTIRYTVRYTW